MERNAQEEIKAHLMQTSDEYRQLCHQHHEYDRLIEQMESKPHVTEQDEVEEHRLKKLKLRLKDQMEEILSRYPTQQVS